MILSTENGGERWHREESGTSSNLRHLWTDGKRIWAVGEGGVILLHR